MAMNIWEKEHIPKRAHSKKGTFQKGHELGARVYFSLEVGVHFSHNLCLGKSSKGEINRKADWRAVHSPKKRADEFDLFAVKIKKAIKTNSSIYFFGEISRP